MNHLDLDFLLLLYSLANSLSPHPSLTSVTLHSNGVKDKWKAWALTSEARDMITKNKSKSKMEMKMERKPPSMLVTQQSAVKVGTKKATTTTTTSNVNDDKLAEVVANRLCGAFHV